jgi:hypothetical protein
MPGISLSVHTGKQGESGPLRIPAGGCSLLYCLSSAPVLKSGEESYPRPKSSKVGLSVQIRLADQKGIDNDAGPNP